MKKYILVLALWLLVSCALPGCMEEKPQNTTGGNETTAPETTAQTDDTEPQDGMKSHEFEFSYLLVGKPDWSIELKPYIIRSGEDLENFYDSYKDESLYDLAAIPQWQEMTAKYDESFFASNTLIVLPTGEWDESYPEDLIVKSVKESVTGAIRIVIGPERDVESFWSDLVASYRIYFIEIEEILDKNAACSFERDRSES